MKISRLLAALVVLLLVLPQAEAGEIYRIDPADSSIRFSVRHMLIHKVHGRFKDFSGELLMDEADLTKSSVKVNIRTASIDTEDEARDRDLRSEKFLDVAKYPEMTFTSRRVEKQGDGYLLIGDLNLHGVTREVRIPFSYNGKVKNTMGKMVAGFDGHVTIDRQQWGINYNRLLDSGGLVAGNEVEIDLDVVAVEAD